METQNTNPATPDVIGRTSDWFVAAKQQPAIPEVNVRQATFYLGMQCEELSEKLVAVFGTDPGKFLSTLGDDLKSGRLDYHVEGALLAGHAKDLLDADIDMLWVTIGAARAQGADVPLAYNLVANANWDKFVDGVAQLNPDTGKVMKRAGWVAPDLTPALHESLRPAGGNPVEEYAAPPPAVADSEGGEA